MYRAATVVLGAWLAVACSTPGFLYTDITLPLTLDMDRTPRAPDATASIQRRIREPIGGIRAEWSDHSPGEMAQISGLDSVSYADVHSHSVFGGIWSSATVMVYGELDGDPARRKQAQSRPGPVEPENGSKIPHAEAVRLACSPPGSC